MVDQYPIVFGDATFAALNLTVDNKILHLRRNVAEPLAGLSADQ